MGIRDWSSDVCSSDLRHRLDAGPENLDVEGPGEEGQRNRRPGEVVEQRFPEAIFVLRRRQQAAEGEVEEVELHQRRRIAEELDVALHDASGPGEARSLEPGDDDADDEGEAEADKRQPDRRQERSEERRVGKECVSKCKYRWARYH